MKTVKPLKWHAKGNDSLSQTLILLLQTEFEISNLDYFIHTTLCFKDNFTLWFRKIKKYSGLRDFVERRENTRLNPDFYKQKMKGEPVMKTRLETCDVFCQKKN